jgi:hypothetical protein
VASTVRVVLAPLPSFGATVMVYEAMVSVL